MSKTKNIKRILSVTLHTECDDQPDTSWLGEYSNRLTSAFSIDRDHAEDCIENDSLQKEKLERIADAIENDRPICDGHPVDVECEVCTEEADYTEAMEAVRELAECDCGGGHLDRNSLPYFNPSFNYVDKNGMPTDGLTVEEVRKYVRQDYDRMEGLNDGHWCFLTVGTIARVSIPCGESSVQTDVTGGYLGGCESDMGRADMESVEQEQLGELRAELKKLGFSTRAISKAFQNIERKEN